MLGCLSKGVGYLFEPLPPGAGAQGAGRSTLVLGAAHQNIFTRVGQAGCCRAMPGHAWPCAAAALHRH